MKQMGEGLPQKGEKKVLVASKLTGIRNICLLMT